MTVELNKNILIVGGGYGGIEAFLELSKRNLTNINICLISKTNFLYHNVASPRTLVEKELADDICIPFDRLIKKSNEQFINGKVTHIFQTEIKYVLIENGNETTEQTLRFDYLVLALGANYSHPFQAMNYDRGQQVNKNKECFEGVKNADRILVVGGGSVGVEMAGELANDYPNKKITLISSTENLLPSMSARASTLGLTILKSLNVKVILKDRVDLNYIENFKTNKIVSKNGIEIEFDAYFLCIGSKPNTEIINSSSPDWLDTNRFIKVNANLQVLMSDNKNIFAIGDCCDTNEEKMAYKASEHAKIVAHNIEQLTKGTGKIQEYQVPGYKLMIVTVGRNNAIFQLGWFTISGFIPVYIKGNTLFTPKYKNMLGY